MVVLIFILCTLMAQAAGNATSESSKEPQGKPVIRIEEVLLRVKPGDNMDVVLNEYVITEPEKEFCNIMNPCCPGCISETILKPSEIPIPASLLLLTTALFTLKYRKLNG